MNRNAVVINAMMLVAATFLQPPASAAGRDFEPIIIHQGDGGQVLGPGTDRLDSPASIGCWNRQGCVLNITTMLREKNDHGATLAICTRVDGVCIDPEAQRLDANSALSFQSTIIKHGRHTVQTGITISEPATLGPWEVNYELFRHQTP